jgi:hypothetical protein
LLINGNNGNAFLNDDSVRIWQQAVVSYFRALVLQLFGRKLPRVVYLFFFNYFRSLVAKISILLGYDLASLGEWFRVFQDNVVEGRNVQVESPSLLLHFDL